jgi:hypothetical protein
MKTMNLNKILLLLLSVVVLSACVQDDDFETPNVTIIEPILEGPVVTMGSIVGDLIQQQNEDDNLENEVINFDNETSVVIYDFEGGNSDFIAGYVISSDEGGNFFEEMIIQDKLENPTIGVKLLIDVNPLFTRYEVGRKIYIKLDGLAVGITNGLLTLGTNSGGGPDKIPATLEDATIFRSAETGTLVPLPLEIIEFANDKTNLFIQLQNVQFNRDEVLGEEPNTFAAEPLDEFDGERILESCITGSSTIFSTSTFADFKSLLLPTTSGSMNVILTKNFFGSEFNVSINSPADVNIDSGDRCDPAEFFTDTTVNCDDMTLPGSNLLLSEDFQSYSDTGELVAGGWTLINIGGGSYTWGLDNFGTNNYVIANAFNSDENNIDTWLISPAFDLDSTAEDVLNFDIQTNFDGGEVLAVYISTNFIDIETDSNWSLLEDANIPSGPSGGFGNFQAAGPINTSCIIGSSARIAFRYTGSDSGITTRYHLDNIEITGN